MAKRVKLSDDGTQATIERISNTFVAVDIRCHARCGRHVTVAVRSMDVGTSVKIDGITGELVGIG